MAETTAASEQAQEQAQERDSQRVTLEENRRLSASLLWHWQRRFFEEQTIDAWRKNIVPHYISSNVFIARAYARLVFAHVRDLLRQGGWPGGSGRPDAARPNAARPFHVLELGAGSGRFSYHFLKHFFALLQHSAFAGIRVRYVMSDFSQRNLDYWKRHPSLQPFVEQGLLDFALIDMRDPQDIVLQHSGDVLSAGQSGPLAVLANYVFDSIEQDAFYVGGGELHETLISLDSPQAEPDPDDPAILQRAELRFRNVPIDGGYYPEAEFNAILARYRDSLADTYVMLPTAAMRYLAHLRRIGGGRLLLIAADKGYCHEDELLGARAPMVARHGSVSLMVNFHALGHYAEQQQGHVMKASQRHGLHVCAAMFGAPREAFAETRQAFEEQIGGFGPDDFYRLKRVMHACAEQLDLRELLAYVRLAGWDAQNFLESHAAFVARAPTATSSQRLEIAAMAAQVWDNYFPLGEARDLAFDLGNLLYEIEYYAEALVYLEHSRRIYGDHPSTLHNLGACHYSLGQLPQALEYLELALRQDPAYEPARILADTVRGETARMEGASA